MTRGGWYWFRRGIFILFLTLVALLLVRYARAVNWRAVGAAIAGYERGLLASAMALAALSYTLYATQDVLGRVYTRHRVPKRRIMAIAIVSYAFNLNFGSLVGGAGFRYRLYSQCALPPSTIARLFAFAVATNWSGYVLLAGILFGTRSVAIPPQWAIGAAGLQIVGLLLLLGAVSYFVACALSHGKVWHVRGHEIRLPSLGLALLQVLVSSANWLVIGALLWLLLHRQIEFTTVLGALQLGAIGGAITHIPAGLGVIEVVMVTMLGGRLPEPEILAALLTYRAIYYIAPLLIALLMYVRFEAIAGARSE